MVEDELIEYMQEYVSAERKETIERVLGERTRRLTVVLEDLYQPHNASAVLRSCECFGIQDVHILERNKSWRPSSGVALGADKWLTLQRYGTHGDAVGRAGDCVPRLRERGYKLVALALRKDSHRLDELPLGEKLALCFGTEKEGLSPELIKEADYTVTIPMCGFTQSFNVSVTVALTLYELSNRLRKSGIAYRLSEEERTALHLEWLRKSIRESGMIEQRWRSERGEG